VDERECQDLPRQRQSMIWALHCWLHRWQSSWVRASKAFHLKKLRNIQKTFINIAIIVFSQNTLARIRLKLNSKLFLCNISQNPPKHTQCVRRAKAHNSSAQQLQWLDLKSPSRQPTSPSDNTRQERAKCNTVLRPHSLSSLSIR
jgi:hypothetical protein